MFELIKNFVKKTAVRMWTANPPAAGTPIPTAVPTGLPAGFHTTAAIAAGASIAYITYRVNAAQAAVQHGIDERRHQELIAAIDRGTQLAHEDRLANARTIGNAIRDAAIDRSQGIASLPPRVPQLQMVHPGSIMETTPGIGAHHIPSQTHPASISTSFSQSSSIPELSNPLAMHTARALAETRFSRAGGSAAIREEKNGEIFDRDDGIGEGDADVASSSRFYCKDDQGFYGHIRHPRGPDGPDDGGGFIMPSTIEDVCDTLEIDSFAAILGYSSLFSIYLQAIFAIYRMISVYRVNGGDIKNNKTFYQSWFLVELFIITYSIGVPVMVTLYVFFTQVFTNSTPVILSIALSVWLVVCGVSIVYFGLLFYGKKITDEKELNDVDYKKKSSKEK